VCIYYFVANNFFFVLAYFTACHCDLDPDILISFLFLNVMTEFVCYEMKILKNILNISYKFKNVLLD